MNTKTHRSFQIVFIFFIAVLFYPKFVSAAETNVELEWEAVPEAKKYDLQIKSPKNTFNFTTEMSQWSGHLTPGLFKMRVRARDKRNVPGVWSEFQEFKVFLDSPEIIRPSSGTSMISNNNDLEKIEIRWKKVYAAKRYTLSVTSQSSDYKKQLEIENDRTALEVPVAQQLQFAVRAANDLLTSNPDKDGAVQIVIVGKKLVAPKIEPQDSPFVRELKWSKPEFAQNFSYQLEKYDQQQKKFVVFEENKDYKNNLLSFKKEWLGGTYRLNVKAIADHRMSSDVSSMTFAVKNGDRSERAEELARLRESIERLSGWFMTASYLVTSVDYSDKNYEANSNLPFNAVGGTLRLGVGYVTKKNPWGYFAAAEVSSLKVNGFGNVNYKTIEFNSYYKIKPNDAGEFRQTAGAVYKELPDLISNQTGSMKSDATLAALGFRYGIEYWHAITSKVGVQVNGNVLPLFLKMKTTNSQPLVPTVSYQLGALASYRFNKNLTTLFGYAYRVDNISYKSDPANVHTLESGNDSAELKGNYLNLILEYQL